MSDVKITKIDDIAAYAGPKTIPGIRMRGAARALGITAWGMNVFDIDPGVTGYPEHDHTKDGQEEMYVVLRGSGTIQAGDEKFEVSAGSMVRVGPGQKRKWFAGPDGIRVLAVGSTPGKAYEPRR
ncbi:MAG: cupin domain-containing protein [Myxococcales bacterium]|nr:cupin domain-containing protein [Myxococcales bacterium]